jgi:hypothetical protein
MPRSHDESSRRRYRGAGFVVWLGLALASLLAGCATRSTPSGLIYRVNPPGVMVQALRLEDASAATVTLRLSNFSTVSTTFTELDLELTLDGADPVPVVARPGLEVPALNADVVAVRIDLTASAAAAVRRTDATGALPYRIAGRIVTSPPDGRHRVEFESRLSPVPGRPGEFR